MVPVVAVSGEGLSELQASMLAVADQRRAPGFPLALDEAVEQALLRLGPLLGDVDPANSRWLALKVLEGDSDEAQPDDLRLAAAEVRDDAGALGSVDFDPPLIGGELEAGDNFRDI